MRRIIYYTVILIIIVLVAGVAGYVFIQYNCIKEGEHEGTYYGHLECCPGLERKSVWPVNESRECGVGDLIGGEFVCVNCGNSICGPGESKCNCPEDCK